MLIKIILTNVSIVCLLFGFVTNVKQIISFNVFESEDTFGKYFANLSIPSLQIRAETNLTLNQTNDLSENYSLDIRLEEPFGLDVTGVVNTSVDLESMAKVYDLSLKSRTFSNFNTQSRTLVSKNTDEQTLIQTNLTFEDNLNKIIVKYNSTLILGQTCPTITLFHNLTTFPDNSLLYFSSNVSEVCDLVTSSSKMGINISLSSDVWRLANTQLKQIFIYGKNDGWESMNATHPLMDVSVVANWDRTAKLMHIKRAVFNSKVKQFIPSFELEFRKYRELPNQYLLTIFKEVPNILDNVREQTLKDEL